MIIIVCEDSLLHNQGGSFCYDRTCPCHEDPILIEEIYQFVCAGLLTAEEATAIVCGKTLYGV